MSLRVAQLRDAAIARDDEIEVPGEPDRRLPAAGCAVERDLASGSESGKIIEQFGRIVGPVARVRARVTGEVVLEGRGRIRVSHAGRWPGSRARTNLNRNRRKRPGPRTN